MSKETGGPAFPAEEDVHYPSAIITEKHQGMTLRQYAAIKLKAPGSGTDWLDEMISKSFRDELAAKVMQGIYAGGNLDESDSCAMVAIQAYTQADAMLKAREP